MNSAGEKNYTRCSKYCMILGNWPLNAKVVVNFYRRGANVKDFKNRPNFFLLGAPKCGTTSLYTYLQEHPNVFMPNVKEPSFFAEDFFEYRLVKSLEHYQELFINCPRDKYVIGEASPLYLSSEVAIFNIFKFNPKAKLIIMVRNHADLVYSYYSQMRYNLYENKKNFIDAWNLQLLRSKGHKIPRTCPDKKFLQYAQLAMVGAQIEKVMSVFPENQIKILLFEDFVKKTPQIYDEVLSFLGVHPHHNEDIRKFKRINANKEYRSYFWARLIYYCFPVFIPITSRIKNLFGFKQLNIHIFINNMITKNVKRRPLNHEFRTFLNDFFRADRLRLSQILKKDLWKTK